MYAHVYAYAWESKGETSDQVHGHRGPRARRLPLGSIPILQPLWSAQQGLVGVRGRRRRELRCL